MVTRVSTLIFACGFVLTACSGEIADPETNRPPIERDPPELAPVEPERFYAGRALYDENCASCHGVFEETDKQNKSLASITRALDRVPLMRAFSSRLDEADRELLAYALRYDSADVDCPPLPEVARPVPTPRVQLAERLASRLDLDLSSVSSAVAGYRTGYDDSEVFDNLDAEALVLANSAETLLDAMEQVAALYLADHECADAVCGDALLIELSTALGTSPDVLTSAQALFASVGADPFDQDALQLAMTRLLLSPEITFELPGDALAPPGRLVAALGSRSPSPEDATRDLDELLTRLLIESAPDVLADRFAMRWLKITQAVDGLTAGDVSLLPVSTDLLRDLEEQSRVGFREWLARDREMGALFSSEVAYLNEQVATYYGIEGVEGDHFREVRTARGGGLFAQAAVHVASAGSTETSPVVRGKWVLENLLCTNLPPPADPDEVAAVQEEIAMTNPETPREESAARRSVLQCAGCHEVMDEIGFGLEGFDAWGVPRELYEDGHPIETAGRLPGMRHFDDHRQLGDYLRDSLAFRMCISQKMMTYLVARDLGEAEMCRVRKLVAGMPSDIHAQTWLRALVESDVFTRDEAASLEAPDEDREEASEGADR